MEYVNFILLLVIIVLSACSNIIGIGYIIRKVSKDKAIQKQKKINDLKLEIEKLKRAATNPALDQTSITYITKQVDNLESQLNKIESKKK